MDKCKILIIEDDSDLREGLSFSFSGDGYDVAEAGTKREGSREIAKGCYDIVLLDCNLPDGTGFEGENEEDPSRQIRDDEDRLRFCHYRSGYVQSIQARRGS